MLHEIRFPSFNGRDEVTGWIYVPACEPIGVLQLVHGFGEHSRRGAISEHQACPRAPPLHPWRVCVSFVMCRECLRPAPYSIPDDISLMLRLTWGAIVFVVSAMVLQAFVREATKSEKALANRLMHDKLTGLPNRYYVADYQGKLSKGGNLGKYWVALADIDDFKNVNDNYGHNCSDLVLENVAHLLRESLPDAQVCRWGGEEFLAVGLIGDGMESQRDLLDRARKTVAGHSLWYEEHRVSVTITLGVSTYKEGYTTNEWINAADEKLYAGKKSGKNQVVM